MKKLLIIIGISLLLMNVLAVAYGEGTLYEGIRRFDKSAKSLPELVAILMAAYFLLNHVANKAGRFVIGLGLAMAITIYICQFVYFAEAGEFISVLALQNIDQTYLLLTPAYIAAIVVVLVMMAGLLTYVVRTGATGTLRNYKTWGSIFALMCAGTVFMNINMFVVNPKLAGLTKHGAPTPVVCFLNHSCRAFAGPHNYAGGTPYAFQKNWLYQEDLPYTRTETGKKRPNVILILTEGTSARELGCYGGRFPELTPNIDAFAKDAMRVDNYFNHTAATFRGTLGQLASCYPYRGGFGAGGWERQNAQLQAKLNYSTTPKILADEGYDTYFFSPHATDDPYTNLVKIIGFKNVLTRDTMQDILSEKPELWGESLTDRDMYQALGNFVQVHENDEQPFFVTMYTFGTHAHNDAPPYENAVYQDGANPVLNTMHEADNAFGTFWQRFMNSPLKDNTIVIFTSDHSHYREKPYVELMQSEGDYKPYFCDKVPLIIYCPTVQLPSEYDAEDRTSVSLAPTIMHLLGIKNAKNSFMGRSIFENVPDFYMNAQGDDFFLIRDHRVWEEKDVTEADIDIFVRYKDKIKTFYSNEQENKM